MTKTTAAYYITYVPSADLCQYSRNLGKAQRIELFHANDILRLWRTFCVNYEARTSTDPSRQMAKRRLKNYKLEAQSPSYVVFRLAVSACDLFVKASQNKMAFSMDREAYSTVSIESQVAGIVSAVHYTQGQFVKKGDLLVSLDDRPFVAALEVARANLAKDRANAQLASVEAERYKEPGRERLALSHEPLLAPHAKGIEQNP